jgi:hypothetical protein
MEVLKGTNTLHVMKRCKSSTRDKKRCKRPCLDGIDSCWAHASDCPICLEKVGVGDDTSKLGCGHVYHAGCIYKWLDQDSRCPMCRQETRSVVINYEEDLDFSAHEPQMMHILRTLRNGNRIGGEVWLRRSYTFYNEAGELVATLDTN